MGESALNQIQLPLVTEECWAGDPASLPFHHLYRWLDLHTQGTSDQLILIALNGCNV